jgi:hypothetical protein
VRTARRDATVKHGSGAPAFPGGNQLLLRRRHNHRGAKQQPDEINHAAVAFARRLWTFMCGLAGAVVLGAFRSKYGAGSSLAGLMMNAALNLSATFNTAVRPHTDKDDRGMALISFVKRGERPFLVPQGRLLRHWRCPALAGGSVQPLRRWWCLARLPVPTASLAQHTRTPPPPSQAW